MDCPIDKHFTLDHPLGGTFTVVIPSNYEPIGRVLAKRGWVLSRALLSRQSFRISTETVFAVRGVIILHKNPIGATYEDILHFVVRQVAEYAMVCNDRAAALFFECLPDTTASLENLFHHEWEAAIDKAEKDGLQNLDSHIHRALHYNREPIVHTIARAAHTHLATGELKDSLLAPCELERARALWCGPIFEERYWAIYVAPSIWTWIRLLCLIS